MVARPLLYARLIGLSQGLLKVGHIEVEVIGHHYNSGGRHQHATCFLTRSVAAAAYK